MAVTAKRLAQSALSATVTSRYTASTGSTAQVTEIYLVNGGTTDRKVDIHQGGTAMSNRIMRNILVPAEGFVLLQDLKIVVTAGQTLAARQDVGSDITMTLYGIEEV